MLSAGSDIRQPGKNCVFSPGSPGKYVLIVMAVVGCIFCPAYAGSNAKFIMSGLSNLVSIPSQAVGNDSHASTAFISTTLIVLPMQA